MFARAGTGAWSTLTAHVLAQEWWSLMKDALMALSFLCLCVTLFGATWTTMDWVADYIKAKKNGGKK